jgi:hypothetical protein
LLDKSIKQHEAWTEQFDRERKMLDEFPILQTEVKGIASWCKNHQEEHIAAQKETVRYRQEREDRDKATDAKLDAILDIKSKAVFLWNVAKVIGSITIAILGFLKIILPFLKPVIEAWIKHIAGK